ncbi:MAG: (d)CMP kinase [Isosphaeraceae bacterium]
MPLVVTIDGPAGAGKSTAARRLAARLGWRFLDTGAMYRAVTLAALRSGVDLRSEPELAALADRLRVELQPGAVLLDDEDVTEAIRDHEVTRSSRFIADCPGVRGRLMQWQRAFADQGDTVTEGRDQGTLVFPDAIRKFFVTASDEERARRRLAELRDRGQDVTYEKVLEDQRARDARDRSREIAPMKPAADAEVIDTTDLTLDQVVEELARRVLHAIEAQS